MNLKEIDMRWIPTKYSKPDSGKKVILRQKRNDKRTVSVFGFYAEPNSIEYEGSDQWGFQADYNEDEDKYYIPEGFYEIVENWDEITFLTTDGEITHWMPKPHDAI